MKILCIADIHGDREEVVKAREFAEKEGTKHILVLGDLTAHGMFRDEEVSLANTRHLLETFEGFKILVIPGNSDLLKILDVLDEFNANLHERCKEIDGIKLAGFGGSNITPYNSPFEMEEKEIYSGLKKLMKHNCGSKMILALHCPPKDTNCDRLVNGEHVGSISIRRIIEEFQPSLVVCSHIHESAGSSDSIGKTRVANIGMLSHGNIGIIETNGNNGEIRITLRNVK